MIFRTITYYKFYWSLFKFLEVQQTAETKKEPPIKKDIVGTLTYVEIKYIKTSQKTGTTTNYSEFKTFLSQLDNSDSK